LTDNVNGLEIKTIMRITQLFFTRSRCNFITILIVLALLPACNTRQNQMSEREASISARESELVALFAELVELRKSVERNQSDKLSNIENPTNTEEKNPCTCEASNDERVKHEKPTRTETRTILGGVENIYLDPPGMEFSARIDTGAQTSSLNAIDIVEFERDGKPFVSFKVMHPQTGEKLELTRRLRRYVRVKELGNKESQRRPVVRMRVVLADIDEQINFTLENRSRFKHQVLIGRNLLQDLAIVDVSKKFTTTKTDHPKSHNPK
jgi:hypothetical protein